MSENPDGYRQIHDQINGRILDLDPAPLPLAESLPLLRLVNSCPYRSRDAACGCSGFRCALRGDFGLVIGDFGFQSIENPKSKIQNHDLVSHLDCIDCVKRHGHS